MVDYEGREAGLNATAHNSGDGCIIFARSPEGEQLFELEAGEVITVTGITAPIEVGAVVG